MLHSYKQALLGCVVHGVWSSPEIQGDGVARNVEFTGEPEKSQHLMKRVTFYGVRSTCEPQRVQQSAAERWWNVLFASSFI